MGGAAGYARRMLGRERPGLCNAANRASALPDETGDRRRRIVCHRTNGASGPRKTHVLGAVRCPWRRAMNDQPVHRRAREA